MSREVVSGIVKKITPVSNTLSLVTLSPIEEYQLEAKVPVFMYVPQCYQDKPVDIISENKVGSNFSQTISSSDFSNSVSIPYWRACDLINVVRSLD